MAKDKNKKPFNVLSKKGLVTMALAGVMVASPFMLAGCGEKGDKGDTGATGANGKSAYELAVDNGFTGTLQEWLDSLKGAAGAPGTPGAAGAAGAAGSSVSVVSVEKTGTVGLKDTYTITFSDGTTTTFDVTNGTVGTPGTSSYTHIKYANEMPDSNEDILTSGTGDYIGIYAGPNETAPTNYTAYSWYKIKGENPEITYDKNGYIVVDGVKTDVCLYPTEVAYPFNLNSTTYASYKYEFKQANALGVSSTNRISLWFDYKFKAGTQFKCVGDDTKYKMGLLISRDGVNFDSGTTPHITEDTGWINSSSETGNYNKGSGTVAHPYDATTKTLTLAVDSYVRIGFATTSDATISISNFNWQNYIEITGQYLEYEKIINVTTGEIPTQVGNYGMNAVAHRGASTEAPENTLIAYKIAKERGFTMAECDVTFTKDGIGVLLHDDTIDRTSDGSGNIKNLTLAEVRQYDFGSWKSSEFTGITQQGWNGLLSEPGMCTTFPSHPVMA